MAAERQRQRAADDHEQLQHPSIVAGVGPKINAGRVLARDRHTMRATMAL
jgi:hypothetical protein